MLCEEQLLDLELNLMKVTLSTNYAVTWRSKMTIAMTSLRLEQDANRSLGLVVETVRSSCTIQLLEFTGVWRERVSEFSSLRVTRFRQFLSVPTLC